MSLTPEMRAALSDAREKWQDDGQPIGEVPERSFLAGYRFGLEAAAKCAERSDIRSLIEEANG